MPIATRKYIDCRDTPGEHNCTLRISGSESEVLETAVTHAVAVHGHSDTQDFRRQLRAGLRDDGEAK